MITDKIHKAGWHVVTTKSENGRRSVYHIFDDNFHEVFCGMYREVRGFMMGYEVGRRTDNERLD